MKIHNGCLPPNKFTSSHWFVWRYGAGNILLNINSSEKVVTSLQKLHSNFTVGDVEIVLRFSLCRAEKLLHIMKALGPTFLELMSLQKL